MVKSAQDRRPKALILTGRERLRPIVSSQKLPCSRLATRTPLQQQTWVEMRVAECLLRWAVVARKEAGVRSLAAPSPTATLRGTFLLASQEREEPRTTHRHRHSHYALWTYECPERVQRESRWTRDWKEYDAGPVWSSSALACFASGLCKM